MASKLTNLEGVREMGIDPDDMVEVGVNCSLQQLLEHGFFHADPHPGNLLAMEDGRLCYLDFGMMSEVSRESRTGLIQAVVHLVNRNFGRLSKDFVTLGFLAEDVNLEPIVPAFEKVFSQALQAGVNRMDFKAVTDDMSGVMYKFPFRVPPYYALIIRSLVTLEGIALSVDPEFKIWAPPTHTSHDGSWKIQIHSCVKVSKKCSLTVMHSVGADLKIWCPALQVKLSSTSTHCWISYLISYFHQRLDYYAIN
jgi:predicted unusual protein kinase regulating ubiquinone biosynthesis (AarF/ABC1/UbiB family)